MKKCIALAILVVLLCGSVFMLSGCALLNSGSESELSGIYALQSVTYRSTAGANYYYGDDFDYYLIILRDDKSATIVLKATEGEEFSYDTTYTVTFDPEDPGKVTSLTLANFVRNSFSATSFSIGSEAGGASTTFNFFPMREDLVFNGRTLTRNSETKAIINVGTRYEFNRMYDRITDRKIENAKKRQTNTRTNRDGSSEASSDDSEE